jgi:hypothetical protein
MPNRVSELIEKPKILIKAKVPTSETDQISEIFQTPEQAVHGLLAHPCALGENGGANPVGARESEYRYVGQAKPLEAHRIQVAEDAPVNGLGRNAQHRADEHIFGRDRWNFGSFANWF